MSGRRGLFQHNEVNLLLAVFVFLLLSWPVFAASRFDQLGWMLHVYGCWLGLVVIRLWASLRRAVDSGSGDG